VRGPEFKPQYCQKEKKKPDRMGEGICKCRTCLVRVFCLDYKEPMQMTNRMFSSMGHCFTPTRMAAVREQSVVQTHRNQDRTFCGREWNTVQGWGRGFERWSDIGLKS
jgi:hypothetical protein